MEKHRVDGGVKVTYIETRFVTSDAAGFKDLVQRLTGRSPAAAAGDAPTAPPPAAPCRPGGGRSTTAAAAGARAPQGYGYYYRPVPEAVRCPGVDGRAPPCNEEDLLLGIDDLISDLFYVGAGEQRRHGLSSAGYSDLPYY